MSENIPSKLERDVLFKKLRAKADNKVSSPLELEEFAKISAAMSGVLFNVSSVVVPAT